MSNIQIRLENGSWEPAQNYQNNAFYHFKHGNLNYPEFIHESLYEDNIENITVSRFDNSYGGIYLTREDGSKSPLADWNNVKVFLLDQQSVGWYGARSYQIWAYFDFL